MGTETTTKIISPHLDLSALSAQSSFFWTRVWLARNPTSRYTYKYSAGAVSVVVSELEASVSLKRALLPLSNHSDPQRACRCEERKPRLKRTYTRRFRDESCWAACMQGGGAEWCIKEKKKTCSFCAPPYLFGWEIKCEKPKKERKKGRK